MRSHCSIMGLALAAILVSTSAWAACGSGPEQLGSACEQHQATGALLPSVDTIGPGTDMRPFLAAGVPAELTKAALRRAWSSDPAIRDFVGLSENGAAAAPKPFEFANK